MTDSGKPLRDEPPGLSGESPMSDPPATASARGALSGQDVLVATRLHVPRPPPGFVPRRRLADALGEGLTRSRVLGLDDGDSDPARFWRNAVAALDHARPGLAARMCTLLGPPPPRSFTGLVAVLINELSADPNPDDVLLVLDDYHRADSDSVHESRSRGQLAELRVADRGRRAGSAAGPCSLRLLPSVPRHH